MNPAAGTTGRFYIILAGTHTAGNLKKLLVLVYLQCQVLLAISTSLLPVLPGGGSGLGLGIRVRLGLE